MKKFLSYFLTFIAVFLLSATGTVWFASSSNEDDGPLNIVPSQGSSVGAEQTSFFNGVLATFEKNQLFNVSGNVVIEYEGKKVDANIFVDIDIRDGSNVLVEAFVKTKIENVDFALSFTFFNNTIYVSFNNMDFKAEINDISELGKVLMALIPSAQSENEGTDISSLINEMLPTIINAINNPVEEELSNGDIRNIIDIKNLALAKIVTGEDGVLKSAKVETYDIFGLKAVLDINVKFDETIEIDDPENRIVSKNYLDLTHVFDIVSNMSKWTDISSNVAFKFENAKNKFNVDANILANISDSAFLLKIEKSSVGEIENATVKLVDGKVYLCVQDVKILLSDELLKTSKNMLFGVVSNFLNIDENVEETLSNWILERIKQIDIVNVFEILSDIKNLKLDDDGFVFEIYDETLKIVFDDDKIQKISFEHQDVENKISFVVTVDETCEKVSKENEKEYFDIFEIAKKNLEFYQSTGFETLIDVDILKNGGKFVGIDGNLTFDFDLPYVNTILEVEYAGRKTELKVIFEDDVAFVQIDKIFVKMSKNDFKTLLDDLNVSDDNFSGEKIEEILNNTLDDLKNEIREMIETLNFEKLKNKLESIESFKIDGNGIEIVVDLSTFGLVGKGKFVLETENYIVRKIEFSDFGFGEISICGSVNVENNVAQIEEFDKSKYLDIYGFVQNVYGLKDLNSVKIGMALSMVHSGKNVNMFGDFGFNLSNKFGFLSGQLQFDNELLNFDFKMLDKNVYAQIEDILLKLNLSWFQDLIEKYVLNSNEFGLKVSEVFEKMIPSDMNNFVLNILKSIKFLKLDSSSFSFKMDGSVLGFGTDINLNVEIRNNKISSVELQNFKTSDGKITFKIDTYYVDVQTPQIQTETYLDVEELTNNLTSLKDLNNATFDANIDVLLKGESLKFENSNIFFDIDNKFASAVGKLIFGTDEYTFDIYSENDNVYVVLNDIKLKINLEFLKELLVKFGVNDILGESIDVEGTKIQLVDKLSGVVNNKIGDVKTFTLNLLKNIELTINSERIEIVIAKSVFGTEEDITLSVTLSNHQISRVELKANIDENNKFDIDVWFEENTAEKRVLTENYLDVEEIYNQLVSIEKENNLNLFADLNVYKLVQGRFEREYVLDFDFMKQMKQNNNLGANLLLEIMNKDGKKISLDAILQNNEMFATINNLKLKLKTEEILQTVHTLLDMFGIETTKYDDVVLKVVNILKGKTIESQFGEEINEKLSNVDTNGIDINVEKLVKNILSSIINNNTIIITLDLSSFGIDQTIEISVILVDGKISKISTGMINLGEWGIDVELSLDNNERTLEKVEEQDENKYLDIGKFADVAKATYNTLENFAVSGEMDLYFKFGNETNLLKMKYGIKFDTDAKELEGYLKAEFKSVKFNLYYVDKTFFIDLGGFDDDSSSRLQVSVKFDELKDVVLWIKDTFGVDFTNEFNGIYDSITGATKFKASLDEIKNLIFGLDLNFIEKSIFDGDILDTLFDSQIDSSIFDVTGEGKHNLEVFFNGGLELYLKHGEMVELVVFTTDKVQAIIYCEDFNEFEFVDISKQENNENVKNQKVVFDSSTFISIVEVEKFIEDLIQTFTESPFEFWATVGNYAEGTPSNKKVEVGFQDKYLLLNIQGLKIKIYQKNLALIVSYLLQAVGLDEGLITNITKIIDKNIEAPELDTSNFNALFSGVDLGNPLSILNLLKGISLRDGELQIKMNKDIFNFQALAGQETTDMIISLKTENGRLESASLQNFEFDGTEIDLSVQFRRNETQTSPYEEYIDLSNSADLVKALINTSKMKTFHIKGNVVLNIATENFKAATLGVDIKIQLDENANVTIEGQFTNYPLMWEVTGNKTYTNGPGLLINPRMRNIYFYYKNGEIVLKTIDKNWGKYQEYTRVSRITPSYLVSNLKYYMAWLLCFNDTWQNLINDAIDTSAQNKADAIANGTYDYSNILLGYSKNDNNVHNLQLNIGKLAYNDDLGTLILNIQTINNEETGNEDFIGELGLSLDMLNFITIKTDKNNILKLVDISTPENVVLDESMFSAENKNKFRLDGEYAKSGDGEFDQISATTSNITLKFNNDQADQVLSGTVCADLNLPIPTRVVDNGISRTTFKFLGWFDENGKKWTRTTFPRANITLYAYWEVDEVKLYKQIVLENNNGTENTTISKLEGETINISELEDYSVDKFNGTQKVSKTFFTFIGWKLGDELVGKTYSFAVEENVTLVAVWSSETKQYRTISFETNGAGNKDSITKLEGETIHVSEIAKQSQEIFGQERIDFNFLGWFSQETNLGKEFDLTISEDLTLVAKFEDVHTPYFKVSFSSISYVSENGNMIDSEFFVLKGQKFILTNLASRNENSEDVRTVWAFAGWSNNGTKVDGEITVQENMEFVANWTKEKEVLRTSVTFKHGETELVKISGFAGDVVPASDHLIKTTTKFYLDAKFVTACDFVSISGTNANVTIQEENVDVYVRNQFKISFNTNGGNAISDVYAYEGETITLQSVTKAKTGVYTGNYHILKGYEWNVTSYSFSCWKDGNGNQFADEFVVGDSDITLTAEYETSVTNTIVTYLKHKEYQDGNFD